MTAIPFVVLSTACGGSSDESGSEPPKEMHRPTFEFVLPPDQAPIDDRRAPIAPVQWGDDIPAAEVAWRREVAVQGDDDGIGGITALGAGPGLVAFSGFSLTPETLVAFDQSGEPAWSTTNIVGDVHVGEETTIALQAGSHSLPRIFAFDSATGASRWITKAQDGTADIDVVGDTVDVTSDGVEALDVADGSSRWHNPVVDKSYPLDADGDVVVTTGSVSGLNSAWSGAPRDSHLLFGLDAEEGKVQWAIDAGGGPPSFLVADDVVYVTFPRGVVAALDARTGGAYWVETPILNSAMRTTQTLGPLHLIGEHEGTVVVASRDGTMAGLHGFTGEPSWVAFGAVRFGGDGDKPLASMKGGVVFAAGRDQVSVVDVATGGLLGRIAARTEIAPVSADGQVYVLDGVKAEDGTPAARLTAWEIPGGDAIGREDR